MEKNLNSDSNNNSQDSKEDKFEQLFDQDEISSWGALLDDSDLIARQEQWGGK